MVSVDLDRVTAFLLSSDDGESNAWYQGTDMPAARYGASAVALAGDRVLVVAGTLHAYVNSI